MSDYYMSGSMRDSPAPAHHQNTSLGNLSVLEINSPLRMMSLNSSPAPASLGDLMHSPQLMQKVACYIMTYISAWIFSCFGIVNTV